MFEVESCMYRLFYAPVSLLWIAKVTRRLQKQLRWIVLRVLSYELFLEDCFWYTTIQNTKLASFLTIFWIYHTYHMQYTSVPLAKKIKSRYSSSLPLTKLSQDRRYNSAKNNARRIKSCIMCRNPSLKKNLTIWHIH